MGLLRFFSKLGEFVAAKYLYCTRLIEKHSSNALTFVSIRLAIQAVSLNFAPANFNRIIKALTIWKLRIIRLLELRLSR